MMLDGRGAQEAHEQGQERTTASFSLVIQPETTARAPSSLNRTPVAHQHQSFMSARPYPFGGHMGMPPMHSYANQPFNSGSAALRFQEGQHFGGMMGAPQLAHNDRPFKCDQCPQSFNRNHDLKRHKRIHLAVKPFPCGWCDKSFSRKDALKVGTPLHHFQSFTDKSLEAHSCKGLRKSDGRQRQ